MNTHLFLRVSHKVLLPGIALFEQASNGSSFTLARAAEFKDNDQSITWTSQSDGVEIDLAKLSIQEVEELKSLLITFAKSNRGSN